MLLAAAAAITTNALHSMEGSTTAVHTTRALTRRWGQGQPFSTNRAGVCLLFRPFCSGLVVIAPPVTANGW